MRLLIDRSCEWAIAGSDPEVLDAMDAAVKAAFCHVDSAARRLLDASEIKACQTLLRSTIDWGPSPTVSRSAHGPAVTRMRESAPSAGAAPAAGAEVSPMSGDAAPGPQPAPAPVTLWSTAALEAAVHFKDTYGLLVLALLAAVFVWWYHRKPVYKPPGYRAMRLNVPCLPS